MNRFDGLLRLAWSTFVVCTLAFALGGCEGNDGAAGAPGAAGTPGTDGQACWDLNGNGVGDLPDEDLNGDGVVDVLDCGPGFDPVTAAIESAKPESCATCHPEVGVGDHQSIYDKYVDPSAFVMTFTSFTTVPGAVAGTFDATLELSITKNGVPFTDFAGLDQQRIYVDEYDSVANEHVYAFLSLNDTVTMVADGDYVVTEAALPFDPTVNGQVYGYIAQGALLEHAGGTGAELPAGTHVHLYDDVASAGLAFGDAMVTDPDAYVSTANVGGCVKCHGDPYMKHGYRDPIVPGLSDFGSCKVCHNDAGDGGHFDWQYMVDEPFNWATAVAATADYSYKRSVMNDTHMSHAMEFPYPQSMATCNTCHEGKLDQILTDENFTAVTCKSCHPVQGLDAWPEDVGTTLEGDYAQPHRAPPIQYLWAKAGVEAIHDIGDNCMVCHSDPLVTPPFSGFAAQFNQLHTGYDASIYDTTVTPVQKYADLYTVAIDSIAWVDINQTLLKIDFSANDPAIGIAPEVLISFYGWDSKNFIVPSHARDGSESCPSSRGNGCRFEFAPGDTSPLFQDFAETAPGVWTVTANLGAFVANETDDVLTLIADEVVKKAEITITAELELGGVDVVLEAVDQTFDVSTGALVVDYFKGGASTVEIDKCNVCHDSLASSFHDGSGRAGDGIEVCKNCHNPTFAGSHLEMASRSIDSYVHAIHSFQDFDVADTFNDRDADRNPIPGFDPVLAKRYDQHINHVFPNFTIRNCEACHREGKYNVPDQSQSMPGLLSASDMPLTWYGLDAGGLAVEDPSGRNIGTLPELVTGPASRACGGCHRARNINDDLAGDLASFNAHTAAGGTLEENDSGDETLFGIIDKIMSMFK